MGLAATAAKLLASLDLDTKPFEAGARRVDASVGKMEGRFSKVGRAAAIGVGAAVGIGAAIIGRSVRSGLENLATLEDATTSVAGALSDVDVSSAFSLERGLTTSAGQVAQWADEIETSVDAAFDDKDILQATSTLIRFGKVTPGNLRPAMEVMTDLAVKTGSVDSAAGQLAKALADPAKAAGKLSKNGIILTEVEQEQIAAFIEVGDVASAQSVILGSLAKTTEGAAKAMHGPYRDSMLILQDVTEDAQKALATGFMPVITEVRDILTKELAKPGTLDRIRDFGKGLAGGLQGLVDVAKGLPWNQIGDAFRLVGQGSKAALDLFTGLPAWVQTAVLTGWGLNKISGGMLGGIVSELGKGLIKGVLGMTAGVVNINAGVVKGGGLPGAGPGGAGAAAGGSSAIALGIAALGPAIVAGITEWGKTVVNTPEGEAAGIRPLQSNAAPIGIGFWNNLGSTLDGIRAGLDFLNKPPIDPKTAIINTGIPFTLKNIETGVKPIKTLPKNVSGESKKYFDQTRTSAERNRILQVSAARTLSASEQQKLSATRDAIEASRIAQQSGLSGVKAAVNAIPSPRVSVTVPVRTYINGRLLEASLSQYIPSYKRGQLE